MFTTGSTEGPDRVAKVLNLFYGGDGYYFNEIGQYKIRASYMNGEHYVVSDEVEITIEDIGDEALVTEYKTETMGMFVALGGSPAARFKEAASLVGKLASTHKEWAEYVKLKTTSKKTTPSRTNITREGNVMVLIDPSGSLFLHIRDFTGEARGFPYDTSLWKSITNRKVSLSQTNQHVMAVHGRH